MIEIYTGLPGSGKTYVMTRRILEALKNKRHVYCNYKIFSDSEYLHQWNSTEDIEKISNGLIAIDEVQIYFNSRKWGDLSETIQYKLQQHRKDGLDIIGTTQHESRVDIVMRQLVSKFYQCSKLIGSNENSKKPWGIIKISEFWPEDMKGINKVSSYTEFNFIKKEFCNAYDTNLKFEPEIKELKHKVAICRECGFEKITHI